MIYNKKVIIIKILDLQRIIEERDRRIRKL